MGDTYEVLDIGWNGTVGFVDKASAVEFELEQMGAVLPITNMSYFTEIPRGSYQLSGTYEHIGHYLVRVSEVPIPAAVWLLGSGLIGLIGLARRSV